MSIRDKIRNWYKDNGYPWAADAVDDILEERDSLELWQELTGETE